MRGVCVCTDYADVSAEAWCARVVDVKCIALVVDVRHVGVCVFLCLHRRQHQPRYVAAALASNYYATASPQHYRSADTTMLSAATRRRNNCDI